MKIHAAAFLHTLPLMLTLITCAKESEEDYVDEDQDYMEVQYGKNDVVTKDMAIENWETFLKQAHTSFLLTESNLHSLQFQIDDATGTERDKLRALSTSCSNKLNRAKRNLESRNKEFEKELKHYDKNVQQRNEAFKKQFKRDIFDINLELENSLEED